MSKRKRIKWAPNFTDEQSRWFRACPKATLFVIAKYLALSAIGENMGFDAAFDRMKEEWDCLHLNGIVPQKPPKNSKPSDGRYGEIDL